MQEPSLAEDMLAAIVARLLAKRLLTEDDMHEVAEAFDAEADILTGADKDRMATLANMARGWGLESVAPEETEWQADNAGLRFWETGEGEK